MDALRCFLFCGCRHLSSPLDVQASSPPVRSFLLDRLACVGLTTRAHAPPLLYRSFAASAADDIEAAHVDDEAFVERLRDSMTLEQHAVVARPVDRLLHPRSLKDVWDVAAALCKPDGVTRLAWQRSDEGVRCALAACGNVLVPGSIGKVPQVKKTG